jgi:uncharacterized protein (TIGR03435 family)
VRINGITWLAAMLVALQLTPSAQIEFDAASIKESKSLSGGGTLRFMPGGGITSEHVPARAYINTAYELQSFQLVGAPEWTRNTYYDIVAKPAGGATATREQTLAMLQTLLRDRFKLTFHREKRQMDGFALVRARPGESGPSLRPSTVNCETPAVPDPRCRQNFFSVEAPINTMKQVGYPIRRLLLEVVNAMGAPASDETGLTGTFDIDLRWSTDVAPADDLPSFATALQDQLGLKLERQRVTEDVFIVDRIERPTPD